MNYRHAFHAGNFGDVLKHAILVLALDSLKRKPTPFFCLDTHAGRGRYLFSDPATAQGGEYREGILRALAAPDPPPGIVRYLDLVRQLGQADDALLSYPGSPLLVQALMREHDRAALCELVAPEAEALRRELGPDPRLAVHVRDGFEALAGLLPPAERRGLVLIDPPYEDAAEVEQVLSGLKTALGRFPGAVYAVWYPLAQRGGAAGLLNGYAAAGKRPALKAELLVRPADSPIGLYGAGMLLVNPPWQIDTALGALLPWLATTLAAPRGSVRLNWLVRETA